MTDSKAWREPKSAANTETPPQFPYLEVKQTESGHSFEFDDTPDRERIRLQHRTGTFIEMCPNGDQVVKIKGKSYEIILSDKNVSISGDCNLNIEGDLSLNVKGNYNVKVGGDYTESIAGNIVKLSEDDTKQNMNTTEGDHTVNATKDIVLNAGSLDGKVIINGNVQVNGDILGNQTLTVLQNVTCMQEVFAFSALKTPNVLAVGAPAFTPVGSLSTGIYATTGMVNITAATIGIQAGAFNITAPVDITGILNVSALITCADVAHSVGGLYIPHTHISATPGSPTSPPIP